MLHLVRSFLERGRRVDVLLCRAKGPLLSEIPAAANLVTLDPTPALYGRLMAALADPSSIPSMLRPVLLPLKTDADIRHLAALRTYLKETRPDILLSALTYTNLIALWAKPLAGNSTPVVVSERIALSAHRKSEAGQRGWRWRYILPLVSHAYSRSDGIVSVSDSVADDLASNTLINRTAIKTIYNPVVDDSLYQLAEEPLDHPWFNVETTPLILAAGRLIPQKGFRTLIHAFALVRSTKQAKLMILGEGRQRTELESLIRELGVEADVQMPGFVKNPYKYMSRASVFVLSSLYEGLPGVLTQALACGCPVVSTDCPGGSDEILAHGKYGRLVPVGDHAAIAAAIQSTLEETTDQNILKHRASLFSVDHAAQQYLSYLDGIAAKTAK
ncbi:MAG TPA: glycosyltransferase [Gammaproteobacteria bacterium]|nr:glycosyltransferase [Gammaproteobacteria bacterium]